MQFKLQLFSVLIFLLISCKQDATKIEAIQQEDLPGVEQLNTSLDSLMQESVIPGLAVGIVDQEKVLYQKGFGYADLKNKEPFTPLTINAIASISKTFIGVAVMKLVEQGLLDFEEAVNDILPYKVTNPKFPETPILVKHLVTHTAGLYDEFDPEDVGEADIVLLEELKYSPKDSAIMASDLDYYRLGKDMSMDDYLRRYLVKGEPWYTEENYLNFQPGTRYEYSNVGADLAARIVELKSGMSFAQFTKKYIFEPLGMKYTAWFHQDVDSNLVTKIYRPDNWEEPNYAIEHPKYKYPAYASGELKTNIHDLILYTQDMIKGSKGNGQLLKPESYQIMFQPTLDDSYFEEERGDYHLDDEYDVGVFWAVSATGLRLHNGGMIGVYSFLYFDPEKERGAFAFCNLPDASFGNVIDIIYEFERSIQ
ncbi:MAG: serine hydrolase domain-containing protein [Bacteroidota bacterium]